jgi:hypothetical protein
MPICNTVFQKTSATTEHFEADMLQGEELLRDLLAIQVIVELNVAFCERHQVQCPASEQLEKECTYVSLLQAHVG